MRSIDGLETFLEEAMEMIAITFFLSVKVIIFLLEEYGTFIQETHNVIVMNGGDNILKSTKLLQNPV